MLVGNCGDRSGYLWKDQDELFKLDPSPDFTVSLAFRRV